MVFTSRRRPPSNLTRTPKIKRQRGSSLLPLNVFSRPGNVLLPTIPLDPPIPSNPVVPSRSESGASTSSPQSSAQLSATTNMVSSSSSNPTPTEPSTEPSNVTVNSPSTSSPEPSASTSSFTLSPSPPLYSFPSSSSLFRTSMSVSTSAVTPTTFTLLPTLSTPLLSTPTTTPIPLPTPSTPIFPPTITPNPLSTPSTPIFSPTSIILTPIPTSIPPTPLLTPSSARPSVPPTPATGSASSLPASISPPFVSSSLTAANPTIASGLPDSSFSLTLITSLTFSVDSSASGTSIATSFIPLTPSPARTSIIDTTTLLESPLSSSSSLLSSLLPSSSAGAISTTLLTSSLDASLSSVLASTTGSQLSSISSTLPTSTATDTSSLASGSLFTTTMFITSIAGGSATTVSTVTSSGMLNTNIPNDNSNNSFAHNIGAIIGVIVGGLIALAVIAIWIYLAIRRRKKAETSEIQSSSEQINISPVGGWRSPFGEEDGDDEDRPSMSARYAHILHHGPVSGESANDQAVEGEVEWDNDGDSSIGFGPSAYSLTSVVPSSHGHYPAFGQAADTMIDTPTDLGMVRTDSAPVISQRRRSSPGQDPPFYIAGTEAGHTPSIASSSRAQSSTAHGREAIQYRSRNPSYDDDPFARGPPTHAPSQPASSYFEIGSSSDHKRSMDVTRRKSQTPPSNGHKKVGSTGSDRSFSRIVGRFRSQSSPTPDTAPHDGPSIHASASLSRHPTFVQPRSTSPSIYGISGAFVPPHPSSLLRPLLPNTSSYNNPLTVTPFDTSEHPWPGPGPLTLPPSPAGSDDSHEHATPDGLLNPRFGQARMDSTTSFGDRFGDHADASRPLILSQITHEPSTTTHDTDDPMHRES